ncbi:oxygenase MpaB family protein [Salsipaludibacter albus]|uniref:oxygenase MpaB family protein n=1 Tax=Salsipaludibacter albus TaxID=2849650 RepID=UPI001EE46F4B|nr:oxygenase MpaB family protein [Salsipaludibacter albus]MBY5164012.1 DUF2236 domain-containing protein [Salsipaludibacter albus]
MPTGRTTLLTAGLTGLGGLGWATSRARGRTRRTAADIAELDPQTQAREIVWLLSTHEFPWDLETALSFALFRTYASPDIAVVLDATGEFGHRARKRYDDTELVMAWMARDGLDGRLGRTALRRMNAMHAAFELDPVDLHYVLTTFICEPLRWIERWGWRPLTDAEVAASLRWYLDLGRHMGLRDLSEDLADHDAFNRAYEAERFRYHPANRRVAQASVDMFLQAHLPAPVHPAGEVAIRALLDPPLLAAFGWEPAPPAVVTAVHAALRARAWVQRTLVPERRTPHDLTRVDRPTYPTGHRVEQLGTFPTEADRARVASAREDLDGHRT